MNGFYRLIPRVCQPFILRAQPVVYDTNIMISGLLWRGKP